MNKGFKTLSALSLAAVLLAGCGSSSQAAPAAASTPAETTAAETAAPAETEAPAAEEKTVLSYAEFMEAPVDSEVTVEAYVQGKQSWYQGNTEAGGDTATVYAQDKDGGYFFYDMLCSEEDYAKLTEGTKIRVTGYKSEWSGEVELAAGSTFEFVEDDDTFVADPVDVTASLGDDDALMAYMNQKVVFKGLTVVASDDAGDAYLYNYDGSGEEGDDLYFKVSDGTNEYSFTVESYLCGPDTDVYKAVKNLKVGDVVDCEGFLYWYNGANPHITSVTAAQ